MNVINAINLTSTVEVRGLHGRNYDVYGHAYDKLESRSYAFICARPTIVSSEAHQKRLIEFGQRQPNDFIVRFQYHGSDEGKLNLDFHDPNIKINYILVAVDVRIPIELFSDVNR